MGDGRGGIRAVSSPNCSLCSVQVNHVLLDKEPLFVGQAVFASHSSSPHVFRMPAGAFGVWKPPQLAARLSDSWDVPSTRWAERAGHGVRPNRSATTRRVHSDGLTASVAAATSMARVRSAKARKATMPPR